MATVANIHTGVSVTREGKKFKATWKFASSNYQSQQLRWRIAYRPEQNMPIAYVDYSESPSKTQKDSTFDISTLTLPSPYVEAIVIELRAKVETGPKEGATVTTWTNWVAGSFNFRTPLPPTLSHEVSDSISGQSTFTWEATSDDKDNYMVDAVQYQTVSVQNAAGGNGSALSQWTNVGILYKGLTGSQTESDTVLAGQSVTRFVRVRARGMFGYSAWVYDKQVYAAPQEPEILSHSVSFDADNNQLTVSAEWTVQQTAQHPADATMLQYRIGKPTANMGLTTDGSWTDVAQFAKPTTQPTTSGGLVSFGSNSDKYSITQTIDEGIDDDECVWIRTWTQYGTSKEYSNAVLAYIGKLAAPGIPQISNRNDTTHTVTITCTNNSEVPDSKLAIIYQPNTADECIVAVFPHGTSSMSGIQCPNWDEAGELGFRAYAYVGSESYVQQSDNVKKYTVNARMTSDASFTTGAIPKAPTITVTKSPDEPNGIRVTWAWAWAEANRAEISWSTRINAWESTEEPDSYEVDSTNPGCIDIGNLTAGVTYYIRVRLFYESSEGVTYGPYSGTARLYLSERPAIPVLTAARSVVTAGEPYLTVTWTYVSMDGTDQKSAEVAEIISGVKTPLAYADTEQSATIDTSNWTNGTKHQLTVRVTSSSNETSEWAESVTILKAEPPECEITQASLAVGEDGYILTTMPLTVTAEGAGTSGTTKISIIRTATFKQERPDESTYAGYEGEVIASKGFTGEAQQTFTLDDIIEGMNLDDSAAYRILAVVTDSYGQTAADAIDFTVEWAHQALMPEGSVVIDGDIAKITVEEPDGAAEGDTVDIYRLSADTSVLIYRGAEFDDVIVDPYPTIGDKGGYRLVYRTKNGDCTTADGTLAWLDLPTNYSPLLQMINFNGMRLDVKYNVNLSESSDKEFTQTRFLGGSIKGSWLKGANRSGSVDGVMLTEEDIENIEILDALMDYSGPARIRTKEGAYYMANVNVSYSVSYQSGAKIREISLDIERVDNTGNDGMTLAEWSE